MTRRNGRCALLGLVAALWWVGCGRTGIFPYESVAVDSGELDLTGELDAGLDADPASCGDERLDEGEECDDGNAIDDDACSNTCRLVPDDPCSPCLVDDDCDRPQDRCLTLLDGTYCGLDCSDGSLCPDGYECREHGLDDGQVVDQCSPELEVCIGCLDLDEDGFGVGAECFGVDCNDNDPDIHPFADEFCDGIDSDCDGVLDEDDALDAQVWYRDADGDGFGDPGTTRLACTQPAGWVADDTDCNDAVFAINPAAQEVCDDIDNNCNVENDEGCPPDLIVDAEEIELSGDFLFDRVEILNGGLVQVTGFDGLPGRPETGTPGTGCLVIEARVVFIRADSGIEASSAGGAGTGPGRDAGFGAGLVNTGPSGGGYGGRGGNSEGLQGGAAFGLAADDAIDMGSSGGSFFVRESVAPACDPLLGLVSDGGVGGGCVALSAGRIEVDGFIRARGGDGASARDSNQPAIVDGGAGAAGGGISLRGSRVDVLASGVLDVRGGLGGTGATYSGFGGNETCIGNGAGGGGGGRIKLFGTTIQVSGTLIVTGGRGGTGPQSNAFAGAAGTISGL